MTAARWRDMLRTGGAMWLWWLGACGEPDEASRPPRVEPEPTAETGAETLLPTGDTAAAGPVTVTCEPTPNVLRVLCQVHSETPSSVRLTVTGPDGRTGRVGGGSEADTDHELLVSFLRPQTPYDWVAEADGHVVTGRFETGRPPPGAQLSTTIEGPPTAPYVAFASPCVGPPVVVVVDDEGELVWYGEVGRFLPGFLEGVSFTDEGTLLALTDGPDGVVELDWDGEEVHTWTTGVLPPYTHHDAFRRNGLTYVIYQETVNGFRVDGVVVLDGDQEVARWRLADLILPTGNPQGELDFSHANAVWVDADGFIYLSLRHLSSIVKIPPVGDPSWPTPVWVLGGDPLDERLPATLTRGPDLDFFQQHNVYVAEGDLWFFDNRSPPHPSRVVRVAVDEALGRARLVEAWDTPWQCPYQGGAWLTPTGQPLATCGPLRRGQAFDRGSPTPRWTIEARCTSGPLSTYVPRFVPLDADLHPPGYE